MPPRRLARLALNTEAGIEQACQIGHRLARCIGADRGGFGFGAGPGHRHVAVFLAWRTENKAIGGLELATMKGKTILNDQLGRIFMFAINMALNIKSNYVPILGKKSFRPAPEAAIAVDAERLTHPPPPAPPAPSRADSWTTPRSRRRNRRTTIGTLRSMRRAGCAPIAPSRAGRIGCMNGGASLHRSTRGIEQRPVVLNSLCLAQIGNCLAVIRRLQFRPDKPPS